MATRQLKNKVEVEDFVRGATYFGTGGGGSYESGVEMLQELLDAGKEIKWVDVSEIDDGEMTACPFGMGSIAPKSEEDLKKQEAFGCVEEKYPGNLGFVKTLEVLETEINKKIDVLVPIELGGGNTSWCLSAAVLSGRRVVDGDYTGRAIPEIYQTTPYIYEKQLLPLSSCDAWGNICIVKEAINWRMAERIGKLLSVAGFTGCSMAGFAYSAKDMKEALVPGTLTECLEVGKCIREARERGVDPVTAPVEMLGGWVLCRGVVSKREWWDEEGYLWGWHTITGEGEYAGTNIRIFFKNENHLCYKNDEVLATSPDMIIVVDNKTGEPLTNTLIVEGMEVAVIGLKAREVFRTPKGLEALGPQNFGEASPYVPIEDKVK